MNAKSIRENIKLIAAMSNEDFLKDKDNVIQSFITYTEYAASLKYKAFSQLYNELLEILYTNEMLFINIFVHTYMKMKSKHPTIMYFEKEEPDDDNHVMTNRALDYYKNFITLNGQNFRFFTPDTSKVPDISNHVYKDIVALINYYLNKEIDTLTNADHVTALIWLSIARVGALRHGGIEDIYAHFLSCIEKISGNGDPQMARDSLEELLITSEHDALYYCGIISKFVLAVKQRRNFEAFFVLIFTYPIIINAQPIHKHFLYIYKLSTAQLFRNIHFHSIATNVFNYILENIQLNDYQSQQVWHSFFASRISEKDSKVIQDVENYLFQNIEIILRDSTQSNRPWISLICSMIDIFDYEPQAIKYFLDLLNRTMDENHRKLFYNSIGFGDDLKESLRVNINNIYKSRRSNDIAAHLKSIEPIVRKALAAGINNSDPELLFIATIGQSIPFPVQDINSTDGLIAIKASETANELNFIENICDKFFSFCKTNDVILTNFYAGNFFYILFNGDNATIKETACTKQSIEHWTSTTLPLLAFDEFRKTNGIVESFELYWKEESTQIQNYLPPVIIDINSYNNFFIFPSVTTIKFPANLLRSDLGYISSKVPVSTLLPSFFQRDRFVHGKNPIAKLYASEDHDITVDMAIEIIKTSINNYLKNGEKENPIEGNFNITFFVGHGARENDRFKGVSVGEEDILLPFEFARLFQSELVVLFVCHSGFSSNRLFDVDSFSLAKELIERGVRHVIAPSWPLNIKLTGPWASAFLDKIKEGHTISKSCHLANMELKKTFKVESAWAAMHHYQG